MNKIEFHIEVEPIKPDTPSDVSNFLKKAIEESIAASEIDKILPEKPKITFQQNLPTGMEISMLVVAITQLVMTADPLFLKRLELFLNYLFNNDNFKKAGPGKINATISIEGRKHELKDISIEDTMKFMTDNYEVIFKPRKKKD